jgi:hypothetical protein
MLSLDEARFVARHFYPSFGALDEFWRTGRIRDDKKQQVLDTIDYHIKNEKKWEIVEEQGYKGEVVPGKPFKNLWDPKKEKEKKEARRDKSIALLEQLKEFVENYSEEPGTRPREWEHLTHMDLFPNQPGARGYTGKHDDWEIPVESSYRGINQGASGIRNDISTRRRAKMDKWDWIDIERAAHDFIMSGMDPEEVTVEDAAKALGYVSHDEASRSLPKIQDKMRKLMEKPTDPRYEDPQPNQMLGNRKGASRRRVASQQRQCLIWKATDQKWYMELGNFEYAYDPKDCTNYGPFSSEQSAMDALDNFSNPGGCDVDESGIKPPPRNPKSVRRHYGSLSSYRGINQGASGMRNDISTRRRAKMDLMTGFTGKKMPDPDLGLKGNDYFERWTTVALPDTGKDRAIDDEQQPTGGGAPATVIPGSPLKIPMEAQDVTRPKLRESPEASRRGASRQKAGILRKVASEIRRLDPITARRLMAAADELSYDALSTATLPVAGDESNEVDDYHDQFGHGTLSFFGTDPAKSTSLTRESSRKAKIRRNEKDDKALPFDPGPLEYPSEGVEFGDGEDSPLPTYEEAFPGRKLPPEVRERLFPEEYESRKFSHWRRATEDFTRCEISFKYPGDNWEKVVCKSKDEYDKKMKELKEDGAEVKVRHFDDSDVDTNLQYASRGASRRLADEWDFARRDVRRRLKEGENPVWVMNLLIQKYGMQEQAARNAVEDALKGKLDPSLGVSSHRSAGEGKGVKDIDWTNTLKLVDSALQGKYDRGAVAHILKSDYDRTMGMLKNGQGGQNGEMVPGQQGQHATSSRRNRRARTQGDAPLKPEPTVGDQDGVGADGAGGFYKESKAPLQETMTAQDVDRPKLRENPEAGRLASLWSAFRSELLRQASGTGKWNGGRYSIEARDYDDSVEIQASVVDRENLPMPVGSILFSRINDSPRGRYATVEVNDGILENRTTEFTLQRPRQAGLIVRRLVSGVVQASKDLIDGITV